MHWLALLLPATLTLGAPLILAAMGGLVSERGGVINIALEGNMMAGALATALVASLTSWLHWLLTQFYRLDHVVSGMAVNAMAFGSVSYLDEKGTLSGAGAVPTPPSQYFVVMALVLPLLIHLYLQQTRGGLRLKAVGESSPAAESLGIDVKRLRFAALTVTGIFCGFAGALLIANARFFTQGMTAGRGFIGLAALILGGWRPIPAMVAALMFGVFQALQIELQGTVFWGAQIPREIWLCLPYGATVLALAGFFGRNRAPAGLGKY
jgi:ABC-type uncharacterized transport system permease subunit